MGKEECPDTQEHQHPAKRAEAYDHPSDKGIPDCVRRSGTLSGMTPYDHLTRAYTYWGSSVGDGQAQEPPGNQDILNNWLFVAHGTGGGVSWNGQGPQERGWREPSCQVGSSGPSRAPRCSRIEQRRYSPGTDASVST